MIKSPYYIHTVTDVPQSIGVLTACQPINDSTESEHKKAYYTQIAELITSGSLKKTRGGTVQMIERQSTPIREVLNRD